MLDSSEDVRAQFKKSIEDWAVNELQSNPTNGENINSAKDLILSCYDESKSELFLVNKGLTSLPSAIGELKNLEKLYLANNELTTLPDSIVELKNLETLYLTNNELTTLPDSIIELTNLKTLDLSSNKLTTLPDSIVELKNLEYLRVSRNGLGILPEQIGELKNLKTLFLDRNRLTTLPDSIFELKNLETLHLSNNKLTTLSEQIGELTNLKTLSFFGNKLTTLPEGIFELKNLLSLNLSSNQINNLSERIGELIYLEKLDVSKNQLTSLPERTGDLTSLEELDISQNQLTSLLERISELTNLEKLDVSKNQLTSFPESFVELTYLEELYVDNNQLTSLPEGIGQLRNLRILDVSKNQLTSFPESFAELISLVTLDASENQLTRVTIPEGVYDDTFDPGVVIIQGNSQVNPFLQILRDAGISAEEHQEQTNYFSDSDSNINLAFNRFIAQSASYRESTGPEKKELAQDLFDIYKNIYQKKDDKEFMDSLNVLCVDSLADCADRNSLFIIEIDNHAKIKSSTQFEELAPIDKYEYLKNQTLFGYFKELGEERVAIIKKDKAEFSEDVEVILNYLRIFNEIFHGKLDLTVPKIFKQKYGRDENYQPTEIEIVNFSEIVDDKTELNKIIARQMVKNFEGNSVYSKIFTQDELANINKAKEDLQTSQLEKLKKANEGTSNDMKNQAQESTKECHALNQEALTKVILNKLETLQAPSPDVASGGFPSKRFKGEDFSKE